ncbi:MAG: PQQ-binding-like beta-propeller repeat protein, partial [Candidatus Aenigmatarchaeota archaeon]
MAKCSIYAVITLILLFALSCLETNPIISFGGSQSSFVLDTSSPEINYTLDHFSNMSYTEEFDFANSTDDHTFYLSLPKNSMVSNVSFNLTGKITTVYIRDIIYVGGQEVGLMKGISLGNLDGAGYDEIVSGREATSSVPNLYAINGSDGAILWNYTINPPTYNVYSTAIGDISSDPGSEVAFGAQDNNIYLLNSTGTKLWDYETGDDVSSVCIDELDAGNNCIIAGSNDKKVYVLYPNGTLYWNYTTNSSVAAVAVGNITSDPGNEIAVGSGTDIVILKSNGVLAYTYSLGYSISSIAVGNITDNPGDEIITGDQQNHVIAFEANDSSLTYYWNYTATDEIYS